MEDGEGEKWRENGCGGFLTEGGKWGPVVFSMGPPFCVILESLHLRRKYGERGAYEKLLIYPYLLPHVIVVFYLQQFFFF